MSWLKTTGVPFTLCGKTFELAFSQNVMEAIFERFGSRSAFLDEFNGTLTKETKEEQTDIPAAEEREMTEEELRQRAAKASAMQKKAAQLYRTVLCILLNDAIEEQNRNSKEKLDLATEQQLGRVFRSGDYLVMRTLIIQVWNASNDIDKSAAEDEEEIDAGDLPEEPEKN